MCMIIYLPTGKSITQKQFELCAESNKNGFGLMFSNNEKIHVYKTIDVDKFWKRYSETQKKYGEKTPIALHFRLSTSGLDNVTNCHPFFVTKKLAFMHNGVFSSYNGNNTYSDTYMFNQEILQKLGFDFFKSESALYLLKKYITTSNKLLFMNNFGEVKIVNDSMGTWKDGIWYSSYVYGVTEYPYSSSYGLPNAYNGTRCQMCDTFLIYQREIDYGMCNNCIERYSMNDEDVFSKNVQQNNNENSEAEPLDIMYCHGCGAVGDSDFYSKIVTPDETVYLCMDCLYSDTPIRDFLSFFLDDSNDEDDPAVFECSNNKFEDKQNTPIHKYKKLWSEKNWEDGKEVLNYYVQGDNGQKIKCTKKTYDMASPIIEHTNQVED